MRRWCFCLAAVLVLCAGVFCTTAYGAEPAVSLDCPEAAAPGTSFSAALLSEGAAFRAANLEVTYDPEILEFRSCSGGEGFAEDGTVRVSLSGTEGKVYLSCKLRFKALQEGESFITVTASSLQDQDGNELVAETRSVKLLVTEEAAAEPDENPGENPDGNPDESADESADAAVQGDASGQAEEEIYILQAAKKALQRVFDGFKDLFQQLSVTEFLLFSLCVTLILLLLVLLAAQKRR